EGQQALAKIEASAPAASRALQTVDRSANRLRFGIGNAANQIGDFVVQVSAGTSAMRAFSLQAPQMLAGFGPQGAIIGTIAALVGGLAAAFLDAGNEADRFREDAERLRGELDRQVDTVEALRAKYAELTAEQRLNREVNLRAEMAALEREQDRLIRQLDDLVLEFGQVGAAMAGIGEGSGELTRTINEFLTGAIGPQELIDQLDRLRDTVGRDNEEFAALADRARELANELLGAELGAQRAQNELEALRQIAAGLTGAQRRLAGAGRILLRTSAQEERFDAEAERLDRLIAKWEALDREIRSQAREQPTEIQRQFETAQESIQNSFADTFSEIAE